MSMNDPSPGREPGPEPAARLLLVDDDRASREATAAFLAGQGFTVATAASGRAALEQLTDGIAVIITDLRMPDLDGMQLLQLAQQRVPHAPVIMVTGHGTQNAAVQALKAGAFHYITKPVNPDELVSLVRQALDKNRMALEIARLHEQLRLRRGFGGMVGNSGTMRRVFEIVRMAADSPSTVLIEGESGTGKELVARALHDLSRRAGGPFVPVNCAALPEALIESELFGHERGAFTGATDRRVGKFQAADGGTLLIDEIGDMKLDLQSKLLRAIETRCVTPVGGNRQVAVDVRIIAATNRDLSEMVRQQRFREDLYYRLNVVQVRLPALRERPEDIPLLTRFFLGEIVKDAGRAPLELTPEALACLRAYTWPGNVRQLRNILEGVVVLSTRPVIDVGDLPEEVRRGRPVAADPAAVGPGLSLAEIEKEAIRRALQAAGGSRAGASRALGISVRTIQRKIAEYGLE